MIKTSRIIIATIALLLAGSLAATYAESQNDPSNVCNKCNSTFTFDGTKSHDPNNRKLIYNWDFGDGTTGDNPVETHSFAKPGQYTVKLTVRNDSGLECDNDVSTAVVKVSSAPKAEFIASKQICTSEEATFDASSSGSDVSNKLTYSWDFGDGEKGDGAKVSHKYAKAGTYMARLSVNDNEGSSCSIATAQQSVSVVEAPIADAGEDISLCVGCNQDLRVNFNAAASGSRELNYAWDFGDGDIAVGRSVTHTYKEPGIYDVVLRVDNGLDLACSKATDTLKVSLNKQPIAAAGNDISACKGEEVVFDGSASSASKENLTYVWDFGDGEKAQGVKVTHKYAKGGVYQAKLSVDDGSGSKCAKAEDSLKVVVNAGPEAKLADVAAMCPGSCAVNLDASGSSDPDGDALTYVWDFGDGVTTKGAAKTTHVYKEGGNYTATVTVDDQKKSPCSGASASTKVHVNRPPKADAGPNLVCCVNAESVFDASNSSDPDGDALQYLWDFGDGEKAEGVKVTHRYTKYGKYKVTLTVKDDSGTTCNSASSSFTATVGDKPTSVIKVR
jgi:PKD repeat protein